ncbi:MAG: hypothetical protein H8E08_00600 [Candidatus Marinimicrobia bacterium]|nr:hypothetical protein [Candidatus Neomarinimicrobiota bacterium]
MKKLITTLIFLPIFIFSQQFEDVVYLKDGSIVRGTIIEQVPNGHIKVQSGPNVFVYKMDEIEKMTKEYPQGRKNNYNSYNNSNSTTFSTGTKSIGGTVSYSKLSYDGDDQGSMLILSPSIGYFLTDNFSPNIGLVYSSYTSDSDYSSSNSSFSFGVRFHKPFSFGNGYFGLHYLTTKNETDWGNGDTYSDTSDSFFIEIGALKGLNDFVYLDYGINYLKGTGDNKSAALSFGIGVTTFIK